MIYFHNANEPKNICCENCIFSDETGVDGIVGCMLDGHLKDTDMSCDKFEPID